jgi:hypothetical protein
MLILQLMVLGEQLKNLPIALMLIPEHRQFMRVLRLMIFFAQ